MSGSELYGQTIANQQELSQVDESAKPEKGESINRIAFELLKKDQRPKNQGEHSDSSLSISGIPSDRTPVQPFGHHDFQQKLRFHPNVADFGFRSHQILNFGQRLTNRSQSEEEYLTDRPGSPSMLGRVSMQRQQLSQFSTEHSDYEEGTKKRKLYDDEASELEDLDHFAQEFKRKRIKMGFTQGDVGVAMGKLYGNDFSQTTISRFEALNLSVKNMCKLKPLLERWLVDVNHALSRGNGSEGRAITFQPMVQTPQQSLKPRKKRTSIPTHGKAKLEDAFIKNPKPTSEEIYKYSEDLKMDREVVRVWFCNRRQKQKRITIQQQQYIGEDGSSSPSSPSRRFSCNGPNDGRRSSPSSDDESFHTSQQMPPIIQPHFGREARLNSSQLELTANEAVKASSVPKAVPAGETSALRLPSLAAAAHLSRPEVIMQTDAFSHPPPLRAAPQGFSPTSFFPMKSESTTS